VIEVSGVTSKKARTSRPCASPTAASISAPVHTKYAPSPPALSASVAE